MLTALLGFGGVVVTAMVTYAVARRKTSGRINTTEASVLWDESKAMRKEVREEAAWWREEATVLREEVAALRSEVETLRAEHQECISEVAALRAQLGELA